MALNRDELQTQIDSTFVATLQISDHRTYLKDPQAESLVFRKDVIASQSPAAGLITIDFSDKDLATVTTTANLAVSFTGLENGDVKYLAITKNATNTVSFSVAIDVSQRKTYINTEVTSVYYRVINKNNNVFVESINIDNDISSISSTQVIEIGPWNMDAVEGIFKLYTQPTGFKVINYSATIISDDGSYNINLSEQGPITGLGDLGGNIAYRASDGRFLLFRDASSIFNSTDYDDSVINRGYIYFNLWRP